MLLCLNGIWAVLLFGIVSARFRDVPPIVASIVRICFFVTPIIWMPELVPQRAMVLEFNPFYHLVRGGAGAAAGRGAGALLLDCGAEHDDRGLGFGVRVLPPLSLADRLLGMSAVVSLRLESVTVDFPVYSTNTRSLKNRLLHHGTGGRIARGAGRRLWVRALEDVTLAFEHGDRVGLVGPNGARQDDAAARARGCL